MKICSGKCGQCIFTKDRTVTREEMAATIKNCLENEMAYYCPNSSYKFVCHGFYKRFQNTGVIKQASELQDLEFVNTNNLLAHE